MQICTGLPVGRELRHLLRLPIKSEMSDTAIMDISLEKAMPYRLTHASPGNRTRGKIAKLPVLISESFLYQKFLETS